MLHTYNVSHQKLFSFCISDLSHLSLHLPGSTIFHYFLCSHRIFQSTFPHTSCGQLFSIPIRFLHMFYYLLIPAPPLLFCKRSHVQSKPLTILPLTQKFPLLITFLGLSVIHISVPLLNLHVSHSP
jgi:hypothetical protein